MTQRSILKEASLQRILDAGAIRLREEGIAGAGIAPVMHDAGLTHGAFYSHFTNKDELVVAAFRHALTDNRPRWIGRGGKESWTQRLTRLAKRYLTPAHRDDLADSCALATLASEAARANPAFRQAYEEELTKSLHAICNTPEGGFVEPEQFDQAIALMALCVGGVALSRAVDSEAFSDRILAACRNAAAHITPPEK
jgi:TetR/AcrR family transcriptional repressor of nem operon